LRFFCVYRISFHRFVYERLQPRTPNFSFWTVDYFIPKCRPTTNTLSPVASLSSNLNFSFKRITFLCLWKRGICSYLFHCKYD
jgi:hypothetical protein